MLLLIFFSFLQIQAQESKITLKDFQLRGKVKSVLETAEKQGDLISEKEKNKTNFFYDDTFYPICASFFFNEKGTILEKRAAPKINQKIIFSYNDDNQLVTESVYNSKLINNKNLPISHVYYSYKKDTIVATKTNFEVIDDAPLIITKVYKNSQLIQEYTPQKSICYFYDDKGTLIKKEGYKIAKPKHIKIEKHQIKYQHEILFSDYCAEKNTLKIYYSNGLLKSIQTEFRFQENNYTFDQTGNWITSTVSLDGKPSMKYYRAIQYFE